MKPLKIDNADILNAINMENRFIEVEGRNFLLFEVDRDDIDDVYVVTDLEEEKKLLQALKSENPVLSEK